MLPIELSFGGICKEQAILICVLKSSQIFVNIIPFNFWGPMDLHQEKGHLFELSLSFSNVLAINDPSTMLGNPKGPFAFFN